MNSSKNHMNQVAGPGAVFMRLRREGET